MVGRSFSFCKYPANLQVAHLLTTHIRGKTRKRAFGILSANARPTGLLDICHSLTPKKYEKDLNFVFRFLKENLSSDQKRKSCDGAKRVHFVRFVCVAACVCRHQTRGPQVCWIFAKRKRPTKLHKGLDFVFHFLEKNLSSDQKRNRIRSRKSVQFVRVTCVAVCACHHQTRGCAHGMRPLRSCANLRDQNGYSTP
jgi:hypothetical protein